MPKPIKHQQSMTASQKLPELAKLIQSGKHAAAAAGLQSLAAEAPNDARVFDLLSTAQALLAQRAPALRNARRALELLGDQPQLVVRCASVLQRAGEYDEALAHIERALYRDPKNTQLVRLKITLLTDLGKQKQALRAIKDLKKSESLPPNERKGLAMLSARLAPGVVDAEDALSDLQTVLEDPGCPDGFRSAGAFQLGRLHEHLGNYDDAFNAFADGKAVNRPDWDPDTHSRAVDKLIDCGNSVAQGDPSTIDGSNLVFVVGMMRSGTSLTEQMIAQCSGVTPGDELGMIDDAVARIEHRKERVFMTAAEQYTQEAIQSAAERAMQGYAEIFGNTIGTDKQPENFYHIPLIARMFPGCKIIHCTRDAMDCCVSNFVQSFAQGHPQTHDLDWLGRYHNDYSRVMDAWRSIESLSMLEVAYEDLVSDPETQTRRIAEHIGIDWSDGMLRFHESKRTLKTASREQVRSALNTRSIARHERFSKHLAPLREALGLNESE